MRREALGSAASWHPSCLSHICYTTRVAPAVSYHTLHHPISIHLDGLFVLNYKTSECLEHLSGQIIYIINLYVSNLFRLIDELFSL